MKPISRQEMLEAAAYGLISGRCRQAYLHDMRGELQTLHSAIELMIRACKGASGNAGVGEKASSLAKRTLATYEYSIVKLVDQMAPQSEARCPVDVAELASGVVRFVRNDAARKSVSLAVHCTPPLAVTGEPNKFRLYLLGLITATLDAVAPRSVIEVTTRRSGGDAVIEVISDMGGETIVDSESLWNHAQPDVVPYVFFMTLAKEWITANGGQLDNTRDNPPQNVLRILYPAVASCP